MVLDKVVFHVVAVVLLLTVVTSIVLFGERARISPAQLRKRVWDVAPYGLLLGATFVVNRLARDVGRDLSWIVGFEITQFLQELDGLLLRPLFPDATPQFVPYLQSFATPELTTYFSFTYVYLYVFLLVFPLVAYFVLPSPTPFRRTILAYVFNYTIGVVCYIAFVAYGPRNVLVDSVDQLLYQTYPQFQLLTSEVNTSVNVFPSLHASLALTVVLLAWSTRSDYPGWVPISAFLALSVILSTMYLGIHWASDVIAGAVLAWLSVRLAKRYDDRAFAAAKSRLVPLARTD